MDRGQFAQSLDQRIWPTGYVDAAGGLDQFGSAFIETIHPFGGRVPPLRATEIKAMLFGDIGNIGCHPRLFFAGIGGPGFQAVLELFGVDACEICGQAQCSAQHLGTALVEVFPDPGNRQRVRADRCAVKRRPGRGFALSLLPIQPKGCGRFLGDALHFRAEVALSV